MALSRNAQIGIGLGAAAVLGTGLLFVVGAGGRSKGRKVQPFAKPSGTSGPGLVGGIAPGDVTGNGINVGLGCTINIYDLPRARAAAFKAGRTAKTLDDARAELYRFGACGITDPIKPPKAQMRNNFLVTYELLRGAVAGARIPKPTANVLLRDQLFLIAMAGVSTAGLPGELP